MAAGSFCRRNCSGCLRGLLGRVTADGTVYRPLERLHGLFFGSIYLICYLKTLGPLKNEIRYRLLAQMDQTQKDIEVILTPKQKKKLENRFKKIRERWFTAVPSEEGSLTENKAHKDATP